MNAFFPLSKIRRRVILSLLFITPIGFLTKFYSGPAAFWVNNSLCGAFYELFWCLVLLFSFTRGRPWRIAASVLAITCALEVLQLWHPPWLESVRRSFLGATLLGTTFAWSDFLYYVLGCAVGWLWMSELRAAEDSGDETEPDAAGKRGVET